MHSKLCPLCGKTKHLRRFCRPKLQVQKICNACFALSLAQDLTGKRLHHAVVNGLIHAVKAYVIRALIDKRRESARKREAKRKSAQMLEMHKKKHTPAPRGSGVKSSK